MKLDDVQRSAWRGTAFLLLFAFPILWTLVLLLGAGLFPILVPKTWMVSDDVQRDGSMRDLDDMGALHGMRTSTYRWTALQSTLIQGNVGEKKQDMGTEVLRSTEGKETMKVRDDVQEEKSRDESWLATNGNAKSGPMERSCRLRTTNATLDREVMRRFLRGWRQDEVRIYVQHMNKGGGTTLCQFFLRTPFRVPTTKNCNGGDVLSASMRVDDVAVAEAMDRYAYDAFFNENPMHAGGLLENVAYVTSIRKPEDRILSQMLHHWQHVIDFEDDGGLKDLTENLLKYKRGEELHGVKSIYLENMQTRHLAGVGEGDFDMEVIYDLAVNRLEKFLFTIPTDRMDEGLANLEFFIDHHVCTPTCTTMRHNVHGAESQVRLLAQTNPRLFQELLNENFYDECLYLQAQIFHIAQTHALDNFKRFNS